MGMLYEYVDDVEPDIPVDQIAVTTAYERTLSLVQRGEREACAALVEAARSRRFDLLNGLAQTFEDDGLGRLTVAQERVLAGRIEGLLQETAAAIRRRM